MATMTMSLSESDMIEAVALWAKEQGFIAQGKASFHYTEGDRPGESGSFSADIEVAQAAPAARKKRDPSAG